MLDHHHRGADHAGAVGELAADDAQVAGGERQRALVDDLADPGQQLLVGLGDVAADHDHRRVVEVDRGGEDLADQPARVADEAAPRPARRRGRARPRRASRRRRARRRVSRAAIAAPPASASRQPTLPQLQMIASALVGGDADVADVAGGALGAAVDAAVDDDPAADPGGDLDEQQVVDLAPVGPVLAEGHDVDVVVDQHRDAVAVGEALGDRVAVPAGHDRRVARPAGRVLDRARDADPDPAHVGVVAADLARAGGGSARRPSRGPPRGRRRSPCRRCPRRAPCRRDSVTARREWVAPRSAARTTPGVLVEGEHHRRPAAGRVALADLAQQALGPQLLEPLGDRRAREAGERGEVGAGGRRRRRGSAAASIPGPSGCAAMRAVPRIAAQ